LEDAAAGGAASHQPSGDMLTKLLHMERDFTHPITNAVAAAILEYIDLDKKKILQ